MNPRPEWIDRIRYDERGLVVCVTQHATTADVLMVAYLNADALEKTLATGTMWYWSRSRTELWNKGATSGAIQRVVSLHLDCDGDALLARVTPQQEGACHTGALSCFDPAPPAAADPAPRHIGSELLALIAQRDRERPEGSYTTKLLQGGVDRAGKKVGEEATEVVIAAKNAIEGRGTDELANESADLIYHLLVLWRCAGLDPADVVTALQRRR